MDMKKIALFMVFLLLIMHDAFAQINESDTVKFQLMGSVTGNYQKGNVGILSIRSRLDLSLLFEKNWVLKSQNSRLYQAIYSAKADNDIFSRNYIYYQPQYRIYPFAIVYISANYRRQIDKRYFAGAGFTYQLIRKNKNILKLSASTVYEATSFKSSIYNYHEYNGKDKINLWRGTIYVSGYNYLLQNHIRLYYDAYWQPAFNNSNNYRTQVDVGVDFSVWKGLSFNALYAFTHENVVIEKIIQEDKIVTFGIAYHLKVK